MSKILNYQVSFFGNYVTIKPTPENVTSFLSKLNGFLPGIAGVSSIDILTNSIKTENRLQLVKQDQSFFITFLPERIDINYSGEQPSSSPRKLSDIAEETQKYIEIIKSVYPELKGARLATSINELTNAYDASLTKEFVDRFSNVSEIFDESISYNEWSTRLNSVSEIKFADKSEQSNNIVTISLVKDNQEQADSRFLVTVDINTIPQKMFERFTFSDLISYSKEANQLIERFIKKIENE